MNYHIEFCFKFIDKFLSNLTEKWQKPDEPTCCTFVVPDYPFAVQWSACGALWCWSVSLYFGQFNWFDLFLIVLIDISRPLWAVFWWPKVPRSLRTFQRKSTTQHSATRKSWTPATNMLRPIVLARLVSMSSASCFVWFRFFSMLKFQKWIKSNRNHFSFFVLNVKYLF